LQELRSRSWQGNVRELKNAVEHAATVARGSLIQVDHLPPPMTTGRKEAASTAEQLRVLTTTWLRERIAEHGTNVDSAKLYEDYLQLVEPVLFEAALLALQHNRTATARMLGLHRTTLRQKLREYKLDNRKPR
jgi:two-component system nitrogen regulation response regulator GlnG